MARHVDQHEVLRLGNEPRCSLPGALGCYFGLKEVLKDKARVGYSLSRLSC